MFCVWFSLIDIYLHSTAVSNTCNKVINRVDWLNDCHSPSPILCNTIILFVYINQLFRLCIFIYSNLHWKCATILHDGSFYWFFLLAWSCETINQSPIKIQKLIKETKAKIHWKYCKTSRKNCFLFSVKIFHFCYSVVSTYMTVSDFQIFLWFKCFILQQK